MQPFQLKRISLNCSETSENKDQLVIFSRHLCKMFGEFNYCFTDRTCA